MEPLSGRCRLRRQALAAAVLRPDPLLPGQRRRTAAHPSGLPLGRFDLEIEHSQLNLADYQHFLAQEANSIAAFRQQQQGAFDAERERWIASDQAHFDSEEPAIAPSEDSPLTDGQLSVDSHIAGNLWQVQVDVGARVAAGEVLVILESMKMEIPLLAPSAGVVREVRVQPGSAVRAGQRVVVLDRD